MNKVVFNDYPTKDQFNWLIKNISPVMFYLHNSQGGEGWVIKKSQRNLDKENSYVYVWELSFDDERNATFFALKFSS